jgi:hypothetical protein
MTVFFKHEDEGKAPRTAKRFHHGPWGRAALERYPSRKECPGLAVIES